MTEEAMDSGYDLEAEAGVANDTAEYPSPPFLAGPTDPLVALLQKVIEQQAQMAAALSDLFWQPPHPDYERDREEAMRHTALDHAVKGSISGCVKTAAQVVEDAQAFLVFLKGEAASQPDDRRPWGYDGPLDGTARNLDFEIWGQQGIWRLFSDPAYLGDQAITFSNGTRKVRLAKTAVRMDVRVLPHDSGRPR